MSAQPVDVLAVGDRVSYDYNGRSCTGRVVRVRTVDGACTMKDDNLRNKGAPMLIGPIQQQALARVQGGAG